MSRAQVAVQDLVEISPFQSLARKKAKEKRTLVQSPVNVNYVRVAT
jgi:hypothetical protein